MTYLLARQRVADFATWKRVFDAHAAAQEAAGLRVVHVVRNLDDPNDVFAWFDVTDLQAARAFVSSPDVPEARRQSGVIGVPDLHFLS
jgi:hypothetical protein